MTRETLLGQRDQRMDTQTSALFRFDSWSRPGLKASDILRTVSFDTQFDDNCTAQEQLGSSSATGQGGDETRATLSTTAKAKAATDSNKHKAIVKIDVHCTPGSSFEDIIKQLENPCLPTFKLTDLKAQDDLHRFASPTGLGASFTSDERQSLDEELAKFPAVHTLQGSTVSLSDDRASQPSGFFLPVQAPLAAVSEQIKQEAGGDEIMRSSSSQLSLPQYTDHSEEQPLKRLKLSSRDDRRNADSSSDTGSGGLACRSKRLACLKCGTHQTPQWRMGPDGPRTMCNACGVKYKKELREKEKRDKDRRARHQGSSAAEGSSEN